MRRLVAAIDLGTSKISCGVGEMTAEGVKIIGFRSIPSKGILRGEVINIQQVINITAPLIQEVEKSTGQKIHGLFMGISGQNIRCQIVSQQTTRESTDELITEDEIAELTLKMYNTAIEKGEKILHVIPQSFNIDDFIGITEPAGMSGKEINANFNLIIGKQGTVNNLADFAKRCGNLKIQGLSLSSLASARAVLNDDYKEIGVAIVDIGAGTTDITIIEQNVVRYTAVVPFGGNAITNDIKMEFNLATRQAEELKRVHGSAYSPYTQANKALAIPGINGTELKEISLRNLARVIEARVQEIFEAVDYHLMMSGYKEMLNAGILITGGTSKLTHICHCAKLVTGIEAHTITPEGSVTADSAGDINSPESATLIGLILNGFEKMMINGEAFDLITPLAEQNLFSQEESYTKAEEQTVAIPEESPQEGADKAEEAAEKREESSEKREGSADADSAGAAESEAKKGSDKAGKKKSFLSKLLKPFSNDTMFNHDA